MITFFACQKESNVTTASTERSKTLSLPESLSDTNKKALQAFFDGSADHDATTGAFRAGFSELATVQNGMLHFANTAAVNTFTDRMQTLKATWNYTQNNDPIRDAAVMSVEQTLGYTSLNSKYAIDKTAFLPTSIGDPDLLRVLNVDRELWIADTIYKYIDTYNCFKISNNDFNALNKVRANGWDAYGNNIRLYNEQTNRNENRELLATCSVKIDIESVNQENSTGPQTVTIKVKLVDATGSPLSGCSAKVNVAWGDGSSTSKDITGSFVMVHSYSGVSTGSTLPISIVAAATPIFCNTCSSFLSATSNLELKGATCSDKKIDETVKPVIIKDAAAGRTYRLSCRVGQRTKTFIFWNRRVWATGLFEETGNGIFTSPTSFTSIVGRVVSGVTFKGNCDGTSTPLSTSPIIKTAASPALLLEQFPGTHFATISDPALEPTFNFVVNQATATSAEVNFTFGLYHHPN
jgi:hypothetical protein